MNELFVHRFVHRLETVFVKHIQGDCLQRLARSVTAKPMILIAGDQLTGKSTLAQNLARSLDGSQAHIVIDHQQTTPKLVFFLCGLVQQAPIGLLATRFAAWQPSAT